MDSQPPPRVLIVDDERDLADLYTTWLNDSYTVLTAYHGEAALVLLDETIDVVILDRSMPGLSGDAVLKEIRAHDLDCRVAVVSAYEPDFDVVTLGFDEYATKPITRETLHDIVETLLTRKQHDTLIQDYYQVSSKLATLDHHFGASAKHNPAYQALQAELDRLGRNVADIQATFDDADFISQIIRIDEPMESGTRPRPSLEDNTK